MTKELIKKIVDELKEDSLPRKVVNYEKGIPTLQKDFYRAPSPMLDIRYSLLGGWEDSTHGDWLDTCEMEVFWSDEGNEIRLKEIRNNVLSAIKNWTNDAGSLFKENRVSIFAASNYTFERVYLIWLDYIDEPEIWVYDSNGRAIYKNLDLYLTAYLDDDLSAYSMKECL